MRQALGSGALGRPRGIGWRGGIRMGNTCKPMAVSFQRMTKSTTIKKKKLKKKKAVVFPVFMYGCKSWTIKKAEHRRIDAFELWCWRRLLRVPWTASRSNQSFLN